MEKIVIWTRIMLVFAVQSACVISPLYSQGILKKVKGRIENTAVNKILNETDKAVSKGIDKAIESTSSANGQETVADDKRTSGTPIESQNIDPLQSYSKYDFIPGDSVLYAANFADDPIGELPSGWNSNGSSVIVNLNNIEGKWLRMAQRSVVLSSNEQGFGQDFSVEFDMVFDIDFQGWMAPEFRFGLIASGEQSPTSNKLLNEQNGDKSFYVNISPHANSGTFSLDSYEKYIRYFNSPAKNDKKIETWYGRIAHVAIQVQKERLRIWIDGDKLYDAPKGIAKNGEFNQLFFKLASSPYKDEQIGIYVSNVKIAKGLTPPRQHLLQNGSFTTTGILFDTRASRIKPQSFGVIKSVADLLQENQQLRLQIVGHTDNVGDDKTNLTLSEQRAAAVKEILVSTHSIAADRLETLGKGEAVPVSPNDSEAGRTQNRRVEFIAL
ncbi:OmpA family protein [Sphingobacterium gobiense]|uniref:OmpA-like domain-containing protein n=1 Tax=Sphingobacterium gobiense TaxID=1382456 RepID=A0A2S9JLV0_9SPHI|nr:OmpA family protein [Sphingobacterium gobiense]PRD54135.1 hypothetical protein C5749_11645 [Sphingobacterium gobiense]